MDELAIQPAVIVDGCDAHEDWYKVDVGYNQSSPTLESGALPIVTKVPGLGVMETADHRPTPRIPFEEHRYDLTRAGKRRTLPISYGTTW